MTELRVLTSAKELCGRVFAATVDAPVRYRFTFTSRLQNLGLEIIDNIYRANDAFGKEYAGIRGAYQRDALSSLRSLAVLGKMANNYKIFTVANYAQMAKSAVTTERLLNGWMGVTSK